MKKLTRRQKQFLSQFIAAYNEVNTPLHYSKLAEKLGISNVTTYEMLRLLEEYGLIRSDYEYPPEQHGPGRPSVVFSPTAEGILVVEQTTAGSLSSAEWNSVRNDIIKKLNEMKENGLEDLLSYLLVRMPETHNPLIAVTEFTTAILLALSTGPKSNQGHMILKRIKNIGMPGELGLNALAGIGLTLSIFERVNQRVSTMLVSQLGRYEELLSQLGKENILRVCDFTREAAQILDE